MRREEVLLADSIQRTLDEAHKAHVKFHDVQEHSTFESVSDPENHEFEDAREELAYLIDKVYRDTAILSERLGLPLFAEKIHAECLAASTNFTKNKYTHHDVLPYLPHLERARSHYISLRAMTDMAATTVHDVLVTILKNTGKLVSKKSVDVTNEAKVRNIMLEYLQLAFEDARKEQPIFKNFKAYKADITIQSLRSVIEYKYIRDATAMKQCLDEVYADMKGYGGEDAWRNFYAVFYMTGPFFRQEQVDKEFSLVRADLNWTPILVTASGAN